MEISDKALREFQEIYLDEYGEKIPKSEAYECASRLLLLVEAVGKAEYAQLHQRRGDSN